MISIIDVPNAVGHWFIADGPAVAYDAPTATPTAIWTFRPGDVIGIVGEIVAGTWFKLYPEATMTSVPYYVPISTLTEEPGRFQLVPPIGEFHMPTRRHRAAPQGQRRERGGQGEREGMQGFAGLSTPFGEIPFVLLGLAGLLLWTWDSGSRRRR